ncbi:hypothetical protein [Streptomyces sp. NBC_00009]|uniref:hypothetical protein n=1 Tax=Streptomyces sp. NBC_00009 TaxID=2975620 RepID=UPI00324F14C8
MPEKFRTVQNVCARLKRAWQVYDQLDYFLLYGSFETDRDLGAFYKGCGYTVHVPGEGFLLERIELPSEFMPAPTHACSPAGGCPAERQPWAFHRAADLASPPW